MHNTYVQFSNLLDIYMYVKNKILIFDLLKV